MEIPDVIAVNKMDQPAAKTMLTEVRSILSLDTVRDGRRRSSSRRPCAGRMSTGSGRRSRRTADSSRATACSRSGAAATFAGGVRGRVLAREDAPRAGGRRRSRVAPSARRSPAPRARPAFGRPREILDKGVPTLAPVTAPTLRRPRGRAGAAGGRRAGHPVLRSETFARLAGRRSRSRPRTSSARARSRSAARTTRSRRSATRNEGRVVTASAGNHGQAVAWAARRSGYPGDDLRPGGSADRQGRGGAGTAPSCRWADRRSRRRWPRLAARRVDRRDVRARLRRRARRRRSGDARLELAEQLPRGPGQSSCRRRRRPHRQGWRSGSKRFVRSVPLFGVQAPRARRIGLAPTRPRSPTASRSRAPGRADAAVLDGLARELVIVTDEGSPSRRAPPGTVELVVEAAGRSAWRRCSQIGSAGLGKVLALLPRGNIDATLVISVARDGL